MNIDRRWRRGIVGAAAVMVLLILTLPVTLPRTLTGRLVSALGDRFGGSAELTSLRVSIFPRIRVAGDGVVVRHKGRTDVPPLIKIASFSAEANLFGLLGRPIRLSRIRLEGLEVNVPPGGLKVGDGDKGDGDREKAGETGPPNKENDEPSASSDEPSGSSPLIVADLVSEGAVLRILRGDPAKRPREFVIEHLSMQDTGAMTPWAFKASLTNPTPPGKIETQGTFGPWNADRPSQTPLDARYTFSDADLGVFNGIRGILQSNGAFAGVLEGIEVKGETDVPDFALADVGQAVPLKTRFQSIVDGTNGNTWLKPVEATLGRTPIHATGGVVERDGQDGRTVSLDVTIDNGRLEDILRLAVKSAEGEAPMSGGLTLRAKLELPPGRRDVKEKLQLDGTFEVASARFGTETVQTKVNELSQKAKGEKDAPAPEDVESDFGGKFVMRDGVIRFSDLAFEMPGARIDMTGAFTLEGEALDFRGTVRLDAKLSELTSGTKAFLARMVEPLFRRGNVTVVPITIRGTAQQPKVGLDIGRAFTPK